MKYQGMPLGMWLIFKGSFHKALINVLAYSNDEAKNITNKAKIEYKRIIAKLPEFEKKDRFKMNIVSCAMFSSFCLCFDKLPDVDKLTEFYKEGMMNKAMKLFCKLSGKKKYTKADIEGLKKTELLKAADRNPYSWNMEFYPYEDDSGYECRFTKCGICVLMKELGLQKAIRAMCRLDYTMAQEGGVTDFIRQYTIESGGKYCDCGYKKKAN